MKNFKYNEKGITLIALVITIIVLLILAGVTIATLTGDNGILTKANEAKEITQKASIEEQIQLAMIEANMNKENWTYTDKYGNNAIIPAGFTVTGIEGENTIPDGLVIVDSNGNEFVWIPVGTVYLNTEKSKFETIELSRYTFANESTTDDNGNLLDKGTPIFQEENPISVTQGECMETLESAGNKTAKEQILNAFKNKTEIEQAGGYYIGRYEARTPTQRNSSSNPITMITENRSDYIYNYVTQSQAADLCQNMYNNNNFISDLANSYAWDTAIVFIQKCSNDKDYSRQNSLNNIFAPKGTNNKEQTNKDIACNIWDLTSNCYEWTTETSNREGYPCIYRGGVYNNENVFCGGRSSGGVTFSTDTRSFRPILIIKN